MYGDKYKITGTEYSVASGRKPIYQLLRELADDLESEDVVSVDAITYQNNDGIDVITVYAGLRHG